MFYKGARAWRISEADIGTERDQGRDRVREREREYRIVHKTHDVKSAWRLCQHTVDVL